MSFIMTSSASVNYREYKVHDDNLHKYEIWYVNISCLQKKDAQDDAVINNLLCHVNAYLLYSDIEFDLLDHLLKVSSRITSCFVVV